MADTTLRPESADSKPRTIIDAIDDLFVVYSNMEALTVAIEHAHLTINEGRHVITYNELLGRELERMNEISCEIVAIHNAGRVGHA